MNTMEGLLGRKLGCTQIFDSEGNVVPVTALEVGPCIVTLIRTTEKDGYCAIQIGFGEKPLRLVKRPQLPPYTKQRSPLSGKIPPRYLKEIRLDEESVKKYRVGQVINVTDIFKKGDYVDVTGTTKGRGFTGVMKRFGFAGAPASHGTHEYFRHGGSIGQNMTPGRTFKGLKMPGHMGNKRHTTQNLQVVEVIPEKNLMLVRGDVAGWKNGIVIVRKSVKKSLMAKSN